MTPTSANMPTEPAITINGHALTKAEAMTLRVALQSFLMDLNEHELGNDEHGRAMKAGYMASARSINQKMGTQ